MGLGYFNGALKTTSGNDTYVYMPTKPDISKLNYDIDTVRENEEYRPDRIALRVYGDETLDWVLDEANSFSNGFLEYVRGSTIRIPRKEEVRRLGVI